MEHHAAVHSSVSAGMNMMQTNIEEQEFLFKHLADLIDEAWLLVVDGDFLGLQQTASHLSTCARALGQDFIGEVAGMMAVSASVREAERCHVFLAVIRRERDSCLEGADLW